MSAAGAGDKPLSDAERAVIEQKLMAIYQRLEGMRAGEPEVTAPAHEWIKAQCADPTLPKDFKKKVLEKARTLDCDAHMRATGQALTDAGRLATEGRMAERQAKLLEANKLYGKAVTLGAPEQFRRATGRLIETVMMTGGRRAGPTAAKPADTAPKAVRQASP